MTMTIRTRLLKSLTWLAQCALVLGACTLLAGAQIPTRSDGYLLTAANWNEVVDEVNATTSAIESLGIESGLAVHSTDVACPSGWSEYVAARGYGVVGLPSGGSNAGTVGTALTNLQNLTHAHAGSSHTHTVSSDGSHSHAVGSLTSAHTHTLGAGDDSTYGPTDVIGPDFEASVSTHTHGGTQSGTPAVSGSTGSASAHSHGGSTSASGTGSTGTANAGDSLPYLQLILCERN